MNPTTTILIALTIGAILASAPASAETIEAPPEIVKATKTAAAIAREVVMLGRPCHIYLMHGVDDRGKCAKFDKAFDAMTAQILIYNGWLQSIDERYTTIDNWYEPEDEIRKAFDMIDSINRVSKY